MSSVDTSMSPASRHEHSCTKARRTPYQSVCDLCADAVTGCHPKASSGKPNMSDQEAEYMKSSRGGCRASTPIRIVEFGRGIVSDECARDATPSTAYQIMMFVEIHATILIVFGRRPGGMQTSASVDEVVDWQGDRVEDPESQRES